MVSRAALIEVFHSVQGEGRFVGEPMAFVRVATCPLRCRYCDTPNSWTAAPRFRVHELERDEPNPCRAERAVELALACADASPFRASGPLRVSITGGEPLVYPEFVLDFGTVLGAQGRVHLETAAHDPDALARCLPVLAHVSADWKLPETLERDDHTAAHRACVELVARDGRATLDVKVVLTAGHRDQSFAAMLAALAPFRASLLLFLQPVTPQRDATTPLSPDRLARRAREAGAAGFAYRVLPQMHPLLGLR
ncbi:MAG: 7-carboxy-7-deazaguanine synthase QueE [Planctomycetota bacterium]